jgi:hypothetical protein
MTPRERVRAAFAHGQPDFTPCDYYATPEIHQGLIPRFIDCGMDALQTIQRRAAGMDPYEVDQLMDEVGAGGGFILAPSHQLQPDTPLENVLTVYRTVAHRRGVSW